MFDSFVTFQARLRPHALAIMTPERWATYAELEDDVNRLAAGLQARGVAPGLGVVSIQLRDVYLQHVAFLALARLGVASSPSHDPVPDVRLIDGDGADAPGVVRLNGRWLEAILSAPAGPLALGPIPAEGLSRVMLSSGSTRTPRRIAQTWRMVEGNARSAATSYCGGKAGRWVAMIRLDAMLGQSMCLAAWATGAAIVVGFSPQMLAEQLSAVQPQIIGCSPPQLRELLGALPARHPVQAGLRLVVAGAAMPRALAMDARLRLASDIQISYGATECGGVIVGDAAQLEVHPALAGAPMPEATLEIVDADGRPVAPGEVGELLIRSERVAAGYIGDPEGTARAFRHGGFCPGDLAHRLPDGQIALDGRVDERMAIGAYKIAPGLVEDVALGCPGVVDAAAFAAPDPEGVVRCWLAVVQGDGFDRAALTALLSADANLPPVRFAFAAEIPRGPMGKVERDRLRQETLAAIGLAT